MGWTHPPISPRADPYGTNSSRSAPRRPRSHRRRGCNLRARLCSEHSAAFAPGAALTRPPLAWSEMGNLGIGHGCGGRMGHEAYSSHYATCMPISFLHRLAAQELPVGVAGGANVDLVRVLILAGHIKGSIPEPLRTLSGHEQSPATVTAITPLGRRMLQRFPHPPRPVPRSGRRLSGAARA